MNLPEGEIYINEIKKENLVMSTDCDSYDDFLFEINYLTTTINKPIDKFIYQDYDKYYEISKEELLEREEDYVM